MKWVRGKTNTNDLIIVGMMDIITILILCSQYSFFLMQKLCRKRLPP